MNPDIHPDTPATASFPTTQWGFERLIARLSATAELTCDFSINQQQRLRTAQVNREVSHTKGG
jgi:hypothetical protein